MNDHISKEIEKTALDQQEIEHNAWLALEDELMCSMLWQNPQTYEDWRKHIRLLIGWEIELYNYNESQRGKSDGTEI